MRMDFLAHHILSVILFTPLVGALVLLFIPREMAHAHKIAGNVFGALGFLVSLPLLRWFRPGWGGFTFEETADWIPSIGAKYHLGIDGISLLLVMLTTFLGMIAILSSWSAIHQRTKEYYILLLLLQTGMIGVFVSLDFFLFYVFWEVMLVPMYFLIGVWGSDRRRDAHLRCPDVARSRATLLRPTQSVALLGILLRVCHQSPDVPVPHLAPRRAHRSAHGG